MCFVLLLLHSSLRALSDLCGYSFRGSKRTLQKEPLNHGGYGAHGVFPVPALTQVEDPDHGVGSPCSP
jgi:hypothetical protein